MQDKLKALALNLDRMNGLYERMLVLLERERQSLIVLDYEDIYASLRDKDEILSAVRGLDKERLRIQDQFATLNDCDPDEVTLKFIGESLMETTGPNALASIEIGRRLIANRERLGKTVDLLREKVLRNKNFIERSVENLQGIAERITSTLTGKPGGDSRQSGVYTGKAKYQESKKHAGKILEKHL